MSLLDAVKAVPFVNVPRRDAVARGIDDSVAYLESDAALQSIALDAYWPKWHSPWWHVLALYELGEVARVPGRVVEALPERMNRMLHFFPLSKQEAGDADFHFDVMCHCALGSMWQALTAAGVDVPTALPWVTKWLPRYQMADGGLNCDESAYSARETASSMVATVPLLEAALDVDGLSGFVDGAAGFLVRRALVNGSPSTHNAAERESAREWSRCTFPRFYAYDTLRGLSALVRWAAKRGQPLPEVVWPVVQSLVERFPDGVVRVERWALEGRTTVIPTVDRREKRREPAASFPLLDALCVVGEPSEALTRQWSDVRRTLVER